MTGDDRTATAISRLSRISFRLVAAFLPAAGAVPQDGAAEARSGCLPQTPHCVVRPHVPFQKNPQQGSY
ncbi:hypothetical protein SAMN05428954_1347 [Streptomyces sp. 2112.3]|nr:hypothetical protein BX261_5936 [Streptomyces sp. 2321.6]SDR02711.1 hypothetical protein SAMN05216511_1324 [Streptomyces sp. KS_16]SED82512.1 hypothetical protein SAMN05428940_5962 [Streptomyces sp. 2133.1]SED91914.1 hypothetical protein SAMN05428954_1347 [Streptomyces sp. 2112.3]SNC72784.1 hypothetical protein SAMN06272741_5864 [Streptomyces sp. 2114.4]